MLIYHSFTNSLSCGILTDHFLIQSANPKSRPVGIIVFAHVVRPSVYPSPLLKSRKTKQQKTMFATGVTMGLTSGSLMTPFLSQLYQS